MSILAGVTAKLQSFKEILSSVRSGDPTPTPDDRDEMRLLISSGKVIQEGAKKGAKYRLANPSLDAPGAVVAAPKKPKAQVVTQALDEPLEDYSEPENNTAPPSEPLDPETTKRWAWVEPKPFQFVQWEVQPNQLHDYLVDNWDKLVTKPGTILETADLVYKQIKSERFKGSDTTMLSIANAIAELAQDGRIRVRELLDVDKYGCRHQYGGWHEED